MAIGERELAAAKGLFDAWSSGDVDAPGPWFSENVVMRDIVGGRTAMRGWPAIREFWKQAAPTLKVLAEEFFTSADGIALTWMMYVKGPDGRWLAGEGMSRLEFDNTGKVSLEIDYWHGPQGSVDDWQPHWEARKKMSRAEKGATPGVA